MSYLYKCWSTIPKILTIQEIIGYVFAQNKTKVKGLIRRRADKMNVMMSMMIWMIPSHLKVEPKRQGVVQVQYQNRSKKKCKSGKDESMEDNKTHVCH